jgi:hypothetical protein
MREIGRLRKKVHSLSGGQARVREGDTDDVTQITVEISPTDGFYRGGMFLFLVSASSPRVTVTEMVLIMQKVTNCILL